MISSYADLLFRVQQEVTGDDQSSGLEVSALRQAMAMAERRIYREVRSRHNEKSFAGVVVSGNLAAIPSDFESCSVAHFGKDALLPAAEEWLMTYNQHASGQARYFAAAGGSLMFAPPVADGTQLQGRYFCRLPDLSETTFAGNALVAAESDLFVFAGACAAASLFERDKKLAYWEGRYSQIRTRINEDRMRAAASAGGIMIKPSTNLVR